MEEAIEQELVLRPWAKINLFLKVLGKRSDGYHEILTLIHPVALFDELIIKRIDSGLIVDCGQDSLPDNLVTKAAQLFFNRIGESPQVEINLLKKIPIGGGLGGGSSDAASTLAGLNRLYNYPLNSDTLYNICLKLGMDVPFFLDPSPALCTGRGEVIERRYNNIKFFCVLINPDKILKTQAVYNKLSLALTGHKTSDSISRFSENELDNIAKYIHNDLEIPAMELCPEIKDIVQLLNNAGARQSFVCGSGSTVCGLVKERDSAEEVMKKVLLKGSRDWWVKVVSSL